MAYAAAKEGAEAKEEVKREEEEKPAKEKPHKKKDRKEREKKEIEKKKAPEDLSEKYPEEEEEEEAEPEVKKAEEEEELEAAKPEGPLSHLGRDRALFYIGIIMIIAGGPGLAMGSWLHDLFEISFMGTAYEVFGPLNVMFAITGLIIMFLGIILLVISLRGGMVSEEDIKEAKAEG